MMTLKEKVNDLIETGNVVSIEMDKNEILEPGRQMITREVVHYIRNVRGVYPPKKVKACYEKIDDKVGWYWLQDGKRFAQRLYTFVSMEWERSIDIDWFSERARRYTPFAAKLEVSFTREFSWTPGEYGDGGSCFWMSRSIAKDMILENGGFACLFHGARGAKIGRCWGAFHEEGIVLFNAYTTKSQTSRFIYTFALQNILGVSQAVYDVPLRNRGASDGYLFINGGACDFLTNNEVDHNNIIDLQWSDLAQFTCFMCRRHRRMDDDNMVQDFRGEAYCLDCAHENLEICPETQGLYPKLEMVRGVDGKLYSQEGWNKLFGRCAIMGTVHKKENLLFLQNVGIFIHEDFVENEEFVKICDSCNEYSLANDTHDGVCGDCYRRSVLKRANTKRGKTQKRKNFPWDVVLMNMDYSGVWSQASTAQGDNNES